MTSSRCATRSSTTTATPKSCGCGIPTSRQASHCCKGALGWGVCGA